MLAVFKAILPLSAMFLKVLPTSIHRLIAKLCPHFEVFVPAAPHIQVSGKVYYAFSLPLDLNVPVGDLEFTFLWGLCLLQGGELTCGRVFLLAVLSELPQDGSVDLTTAEKLFLSVTTQSEKIIPNNRKPCTSPPIDNLENI